MIKSQREADAEYRKAMEDYNAKVQAAEAEKAVLDNIMSEIQRRDYARMQQEEADAKAREEEEN